MEVLVSCLCSHTEKGVCVCVCVCADEKKNECKKWMPDLHLFPLSLRASADALQQRCRQERDAQKEG